ncbi:MAG TPA: hypothetical protein VGE04_07680, partial [Chloroflexia bacterium]
MPESSPARHFTTLGRCFRTARRLSLAGALLLLLSLFALSAGALIATAGDLTAKTPASPVTPPQAISPAGECAPAWTDSGSVSLVADQQWFTGVSAVSPDDVWAVGLFNRGTWSDSLVEHWNGERWRVVPSPQGSKIPYAVEAIHADDVWVVGVQGLTEHWNGSQWTVLPAPDFGSGYTNLNDISAASSSDIWAVGERYTDSDSTTRVRIQRWNGSEWNIVPLPVTGTVGTLLGVEAISSDDAWAVGHTGDGDTLTLHWNGIQWTVVPSPNPGTVHSLNAVSAVSSNDVWAVGAYDDPNDPRLGAPLAMHWDGVQWTVVPGPDAGDEGGRLESVVSLGSNDVWAVGAPNLTAHWDGS